MSRLFAPLLAAAVIACATDGPPPVPYELPLPPPVMPPMPIVDQARDLGVPAPPGSAPVTLPPVVATYLGELSAAATARDEAALRRLMPIAPYLDEALATEGPERSLKVHLVSTAETAVGHLVLTRLDGRGGHAPPRDLESGVLLDHAGQPAPVTAGTVKELVGRVPVVRVTGTIELAPRVPWIAGDLVVELAHPTTDRIAMLVPPPPISVEVTQGGVPCAVDRLGELAIVTPAVPDAPPRYRIRFAGTSSLWWSGDPTFHDTGRVDELPGFDELHPRDVDVTVRHPRGSRVVSTLVGRTSPDPWAPWITTRFTGRTEELPLLVGRAGPVQTASIAAAGTTITLELTRFDTEQMRETLDVALGALAPLGDLPVRDLRIVDLEGVPVARYHHRLVVLPASVGDVPEALRRPVVHELAHTWFAGTARADFHDATRWWEAAASLTETWVLDAPEALACRAQWLERVNRLRPEHERLVEENVFRRDERSDTMSYARAALVLAGLERRVGRDAVVRWMRVFVDTQRGKRTGLRTMIASAGVVLGVEHERWLARWLLADTPATIGAAVHRVDPRTLDVTLTVTGPLVEEESIEVCFDGRERLGRVEVRLTGEITRVQVPVPAGAWSMVLACDARLPVRPARPWDPLLAADLSALAIPLDDRDPDDFLPPDVRELARSSSIHLDGAGAHPAMRYTARDDVPAPYAVSEVAPERLDPPRDETWEAGEDARRGDPLAGWAAVEDLSRPLRVGSAVRVHRSILGVVEPSSRFGPERRVPFAFMHGSSGGAEFREGFSWDELARTRARRTRATVWIDPRRGWVDADTTLDIDRDGGVIVLERALGASYAITDVRWNGRPVPWVGAEAWIFVSPPAAGAGTLRVRQRGRPEDHDDVLDRDRAVLHTAVPVVPGATTELDVVVHAPAELRVHGALPAVSVPSVAGWRGWRVHGRADHLDVVVGVDRPTRIVEHGGVRWELAHDIADGEVRAAVDALAALGAPPARSASIVAAPSARRETLPPVATGALVPVALRGDTESRAHALPTALAAWWLSSTPDDGRSPCSWRRAAALHLGTWALAVEEAATVRRHWTALAAHASPYRLDTNGPAMAIVTPDHCARGALVWAELERHIGRPGVAAVIRRLLDGGAMRWSAVADAVEHPGAAAWLRAWIDRPLPPSFGLRDVARTGATTVTGELVEDRGIDAELAPHGAPVTIALFHGADELARIEVPAGPFTFELRAPPPPGAYLVLDPDGHVPMRPGALPAAVRVPPDR